MTVMPSESKLSASDLLMGSRLTGLGISNNTIDCMLQTPKVSSYTISLALPRPTRLSQNCIPLLPDSFDQPENMPLKVVDVPPRFPSIPRASLAYRSLPCKDTSEQSRILFYLEKEETKSFSNEPESNSLLPWFPDDLHVGDAFETGRRVPKLRMRTSATHRNSIAISALIGLRLK